MKFLRQNWFRHKRLGRKWRRPRGSQSKLRKQKKGKGRIPKIGYKKPEAERGLVPYKGMKVRAHYIRSPKEIEDGMEYIIVASSIGIRKLHQIYLICKEKDIKIVNYKKLNRMFERLKELKRKKESKEEPGADESKKEEQEAQSQESASQQESDGAKEGNESQEPPSQTPEKGGNEEVG